MDNKVVVFVVCLFLAGAIAVSYAQAQTSQQGSAVIKDGSIVKFDYTLTVDGKVEDSSEGRGPLEYVHGKGTIIPGLAKQLAGMKAGEEKTVVVAPAEGYGEFRPEAIQEVEKSKLPPTLEPKVGMSLQVKRQDGAMAITRIKEVKENTIVLDFNHPLAGKTLTFQVKIVSIQ